jgi:uncharacterized protein (TIGR03435 family)
MTIRVLLLSVAAFSVFAQQQAPAPSPSRRFEVASIKPSSPDASARDMRIRFPGNRFDAVSVTLFELLPVVYPQPGMKIEGGPDWVRSDRFDIAAVADANDGPVTPAQQLQMVQRLLEDRFKFAFHVEKKEVPGLALVAGKSAPKFDPVKEGEVTRSFPVDGGNKTGFEKMSVGGLAFVVSNMLHIPVADHTGVQGNFDFTLDPGKFILPPDSQPSGMSRQDYFRESYPDRVRAAIIDLGIGIEAWKGTSFTMVIDRVDHPGGN